MKTVSNFLLSFPALVCLAYAAVPHANAQDSERILDFRSDITVHEDSTMDVRETIVVNALGQRIQRGIYRDFPTTYEDDHGTDFVVGFDVQEVFRDGNPEPYHTEDLSNGVRVYFGRADYILPPGEYTYTLVYRTNRQLGFFDAHDELFWNVTGNGWEFPIENASASVTLPEGIAESSLQLHAYTGSQGTQGTDFTSEIVGPSAASFATTRTLAPREGLTVVVSFPKGFVEKPTIWMEVSHFFLPGPEDFVMLAGIVILLIYYGFAWARVGIDPPKGRILPRERPPEDLSPQALRYVHRFGFDQKMFSVALIDMAVKGYLRIEQEGDDKKGTYFIVRVNADDEILTKDERAIARTLFEDGESIELKTENHAKVGKAMADFWRGLHKEYRGVFFHRNLLYILPGVLICLATIAWAVFMQEGEGKEVALFMSVWLSGWTVGVCALVAAALASWKKAFQGMGGFGAAIFLSVFSIPFVGGELVGLAVVIAAVSIFFPLGLVTLVILSAIFVKLIEAPTLEGRRVLDEIEGFKMYLEGEGTSPFSRAAGSESLERRFERYLPFAMALGMEKPWAEEFTRALDGASSTDRAYAPMWYHGNAWTTLGASGFTTSLNDSLSTAIISSASPPGSSSGGGFSGGGGGGGSSGGGGGGGGGGGW